jgi:hypothetical protein
MHNFNEGKRTLSGILFVYKTVPNRNEPTHVSVSYTLFGCILNVERKITTAKFSGHELERDGENSNAIYPHGQPVVQVD